MEIRGCLLYTSRIVVHKDDTLWKAEPFHGRHDVVLYRFSANGEGDFRVEQTAFPDMARYGNTAAEQVQDVYKRQVLPRSASMRNNLQSVRM